MIQKTSNFSQIVVLPAYPKKYKTLIQWPNNQTYFLNFRLLDLSTDIAVEDFHINGKMQFVFSFNRNIPFPHLAAISLCFLEE